MKIIKVFLIKFQTFKTELGITRNTPLAAYQEKNSKNLSNQYDLVKSLDKLFLFLIRLNVYRPD